MPIVSAAHARMGSDPNISFKAASRNSPPSEQSKPKSGEEHRAHLDSAQELPCALLFVFRGGGRQDFKTRSQKAPNQAACCKKLPFISQEAPPRNPEARLLYHQPRSQGLDLVLLTRESEIHASSGEKGWMLASRGFFAHVTSLGEKRKAHITHKGQGVHETRNRRI